MSGDAALRELTFFVQKGGTPFHDKIFLPLSYKEMFCTSVQRQQLRLYNSSLS